MARIESDPNYTTPTFSRATAATDPFKKEDVQQVAAALSTHTHGTGFGLPVAALAASVAVPGGGTLLAGGVVSLPSGSGSMGHLMINGGKIANSDIAWYGTTSAEDMLILNSGGQMIFRSPQVFTVTDMGGTIRMQVGTGGAMSCGTTMTVNTSRGVNAGGLVMQAQLAGNDTLLFSEGGGTFLWFGNAAGSLSLQTTGGGAYRPINASAFTVGSSKRYKENLTPLDQATMLAQVMDPQVQPYSYSLVGSGDESIGFMAEDMLNVVPEAVSLNEEGAPEGINYNALVPILWGAVRELNDRLKPPA